MHAHFDRLLGLLGNIDLAAGIVSNDHHGKAWGDAMCRLEPRDVAGDAAAEPFGIGLSVDDL
jgi:hypothetical protein